MNLSMINIKKIRTRSRSLFFTYLLSLEMSLPLLPISILSGICSSTRHLKLSLRALHLPHKPGKLAYSVAVVHISMFWWCVKRQEYTISNSYISMHRNENNEASPGQVEKIPTQGNRWCHRDRQTSMKPFFNQSAMRLRNPLLPIRYPPYDVKTFFPRYATLL